MGKSRVSAAERLRQRMAEKGWSQTQLSVEMDVEPGVVSRWLSGKRTPSLRMACRIEERLGIPVEVWLGAKAS